MYNAFMHRYLVVELKRGEFQPKYIGKLNFYCSAVDDILCREETIPTISTATLSKQRPDYGGDALRDVHKPIGISDYELVKLLAQRYQIRTSQYPVVGNKLSLY